MADESQLSVKCKATIHEKNGGSYSHHLRNQESSQCTEDGAVDGELGSGHREPDMTVGFARKTTQQAVRNADMKSGGR